MPDSRRTSLHALFRLTDEQRRALARIRHSQRHLLGLVTGVLNYSRVEAGAVQYSMEDVPVADTLAAGKVMMAPQYAARRVAFAYMPCGRSLLACAGAEKLRQIVLNLLTNALEFTEAGGHVTLGCRAGSGTVTITVSDT